MVNSEPITQIRDLDTDEIIGPGVGGGPCELLLVFSVDPVVLEEIVNSTETFAAEL
jgi:hypothetical protein